MALKINGWQRLWIVLSVLYLLAVIGFDAMIWPKTTNAEKQFLNETYQLIYDAEGKSVKYNFSDIVEEMNRRGLNNNPQDEKEKMMAAEDWVGLAEQGASKHNEVDFSIVRNKYETTYREITADRKKIFRFSLLLWILPVFALYLMGLAVGWIIRGFKKSKMKMEA